MSCRTRLAMAILLAFSSGCTVERSDRKVPAHKSVSDALVPREDLPAPVEGIAAAILVDTSGSMKDPVDDADGVERPKIEIARRAVLETLRQFEDFARRNPERKLLVGVYEFSSRGDRNWCREVVPLAPPDLAAAREAVNAMRPEGGTPIGQAMVIAKQTLDRAGLSRRHLLIVTDGQNNRGYSPGDVALAIGRLAEANRALIHFIAFDVAAERFRSVQDAGGLVLEASNERDLRQTLDFVMTGRILAEQPASEAVRQPAK